MNPTPTPRLAPTFQAGRPGNAPPSLARVYLTNGVSGDLG